MPERHIFSDFISNLGATSKWSPPKGLASERGQVSCRYGSHACFGGVYDRSPYPAAVMAAKDGSHEVTQGVVAEIRADISNAQPLARTQGLGQRMGEGGQ